ncbi:hypothetical protein SNOG_09921 [Parastagonospora nodorum SN15]|uniref:Uncharacterized protein n=1 Tax=Phaeosphaeria nodorum (strain SN15 / ATCC MYA-4574 / FGSC 10173) TaxID=321614 RepID=Q0UE93_PHANO|nr:hypothetical protein SNOG_09921 [Parastagonospora nodorum SN15]EAT82256.1 hypothetical protein SNOG_09921 [Parastagonospora nodorum SN15]
MSVYVITGVSRGIGFEFVKQFSEDSNNLIVGLVRDKATTEKKVAAELGDRSNVHILHADLTNYASLKQAAADTAEIVGERGIDYLVANGGIVPYLDGFGPIGALYVYFPLVTVWFVANADLDFTNEVGIDIGSLYAASKAAMNIIVAKFSVQYKSDGVLFMAISPGVVEVGHYSDITPQETEGLMAFVGKLAAYAPHFKGPISTEESVRAVSSVWEKASIENGDGGTFVSHLGNKQWV